MGGLKPTLYLICSLHGFFDLWVKCDTRLYVVIHGYMWLYVVIHGYMGGYIGLYRVYVGICGVICGYVGLYVVI